LYYFCGDEILDGDGEHGEVDSGKEGKEGAKADHEGDAAGSQTPPHAESGKTGSMAPPSTQPFDLSKHMSKQAYPFFIRFECRYGTRLLAYGSIVCVLEACV
jgi:hypothetical protein